MCKEGQKFSYVNYAQTKVQDLDDFDNNREPFFITRPLQILHWGRSFFLIFYIER